MYAVDRFTRGRRQLSWAALAIAALVLLDPQTARADPGVPVPPNELIPDRGKGAVSAADEDFLVKVRLAGLWEIPAGDMAQEKSGNPRIRAIGKDIAAQHEVLDKLVRDAAQKLDVDLPDKPNTDQQTWLAEMRDADDGRDFDQIYIDRLRAAHGKIFPAIATIRASTRNDTVRKLAQRANQFVATHMTLLESSGIVDFAALPTAPAPAAATTGRTTRLTSAPGGQSAGIGTPVVAVVVAAALSVALLASRTLLRRRPPVRRSRRRYYADG